MNKWGRLRSDTRPFFLCIFLLLCRISCKNEKKCKKMQKKFKKICIYQKKVLPLHRQIKKDTKKKPKNETQKQRKDE